MISSRMLEQLNEGGISDNFLSVGRALSESRWSELCNDAEMPIQDDTAKYGLAVMLENTNRFLSSLDETTRAVAIGDFQKYAFPLVRAIFPELAANSLVSVQPMLGPTSLVFYLDFVYGSNKGSVRRGDTAFSSVARGPANPSYTSDFIDTESVGSGAGTANPSVTNFSYLPLIPGTVTITDGTQVLTDDGAGALGGDGTGTVNYQTGATTVVFSNVVPSGQALTASYRYDMEANANIPSMDLVLQSSPVVARPRKLKTAWSLEAAFNLRSLHGLEAEVELTSAVGAEIRYEIDREIINDLQVLAGAGSVFWNKDLPLGVSYTEQKLSINDAFVVGGNIIHKATGRATATWIFGGEGVANVVETLPNFVAVPGLPNAMSKGVYRAGRLSNRWDFFKDPFYADNFFMMGYKGQLFLEAGYIYAPYIPLYTTPTIVLDDFVGRKGLATQYGKKSINPLFYVTGEIGTGAALETKAGLSAGTLSSSGTAKITHGSATDIGFTSGRGVFGV
jgi:hypothetical protein